MRTFFEDLGKRFEETAETVTNKAGEVVEIQKLKSQIRALQRGNASDMIDLGRMVYDSFKDGAEVSEEAAGLCEAIQSREESIADYEKKIADVRGDFECENCGKTMAKGMAYCPFCGTKAAEDIEEEPDFVDELKEKAAEAAEKAADVAEGAAEKASEAAEKAAEKIGEAAEKVAEKAEEAAEKIKEDK